ncbi:MAG: zf-HC2 domain-containing protein [Stenotrophobium sp.]
MLNCREVNQRATDYLELQMNWRERLAVRMHLLICWTCRRFLRQLDLTRNTLRRIRLKSSDADEAAVRRIQQAVAALPPDNPPQ